MNKKINFSFQKHHIHVSIQFFRLKFIIVFVALTATNKTYTNEFKRTS